MASARGEVTSFGSSVPSETVVGAVPRLPAFLLIQSRVIRMQLLVLGRRQPSRAKQTISYPPMTAAWMAVQ